MRQVAFRRAVHHPKDISASAQSYLEFLKAMRYLEEEVARAQGPPEKGNGSTLRKTRVSYCMDI